MKYEEKRAELMLRVKRDPHLFFKTMVTGQMLQYATLPVIDHDARQSLSEWYKNNGYPEDELKRCMVEVTYRVLPR